MSVFSMAASNPAAPTYPLQRSVRLRASNTAYFNRTPASATNQQRWTWSGWVKRGSLGSAMTLFAARTGAAATYSIFRFGIDTLIFEDNSITALTTAAVYRDPSSWYHIVLAVDTTQATSTNRVVLYVNGVLVSFSTGTFPTKDANLQVNSTQAHLIGQQASGQYLDGYLTEVNFIDGYALTPSSFGAYNSYGVWSPAKYTGTYGTNGFYLNFQDNSAVTTTSNVGIGKDSSGNGNYWTSNGINVTAYSGTPPNNVSYDSMLDVPTNTSSINANFAVMNPLKTYTSNLALTNGNLTLSDSNAVVTSAISTMSFGTSGKYYFECTMVAVPTANSNYVGVIDAATAFGTAPFQNKGEYRNTGDIYNLAGTPQTVGATYTTNDVIGVAVDVTAGTVRFYKNGVAQGATPSFTFTARTELWACVSTDNQVGTKTYAMNFGQRPFSYPLAGFNPLCTFNLPDSIIPVGAQYFAATTYTGTGAPQIIVNTTSNPLVAPYSNNPKAVPLQPDLVWIKKRSGSDNHELTDSVRGNNLRLASDTTGIQSAGGISMSSTGFNLVGTPPYGTDNENTFTYVAWQWRASNASAVTNTAGSITSQVSANPTAGFSVVAYTGTGANATVGHGLGVAPKMVIVKHKSGGGLTTQDWDVYHSGLTSAAYRLFLNTTAGQQNAPQAWNSTAPEPTVFSVGTGTDTNGIGAAYVAYCWAEVPGFSKFGSYVGTGVGTTGAFVYCGFRPRWILLKATLTGSSENWELVDTTRNQYNAGTDQWLYPNLPAQEGTTSAGASTDILSNGFKLRGFTGTPNTSGTTYIFAAFAENPFKNALAR